MVSIHLRHNWWSRYLEEGSGVRDRSHAPKTNPREWSSEICQAILNIRDRLMRRYRLAGAPTIHHELDCLGYEPLPSLRTIDRILQWGERNLVLVRVPIRSHLPGAATNAIRWT